LRHSELRLTEAQAIAHVGSWEINFATGISLWSEEACRIYGLSQSPVLPGLVIAHSSRRPGVVFKTTKQAEATHSSSAFYHRIIRKDGEVRYIYSKTEFDFRDGLPVGLHGIAHDITEQKLVSAERGKLLADLVKRNNDLEQFSYIISHNLRAPVVNILGISELIRVGGLEKEDEKTLMTGLESSVSRLDEVINDLNYILQLNNKEQQNKEWVKLSELINDIKSSISSEFINEKVNFILDFSAIDEVLTLKVYLYSIFYNLIINSIKYKRPDLPPEITITSFKSGDNITIVVKDNGLGIDLPKKRDEVFGLYKRFHAHVEGKGIGLYMVKKQVESLKGSITVESEVNKGTEFKIQFDL
jgi:PAS domain S-box-containing protein